MPCLGQEQAGTKQQELVWEVGLGGTSCLSSAPWPQPTPVLREMDLLPAAACASTSDEQNNSCFPGSPSRTQCASRGQWGWGGSWDEAGGPDSPWPAVATARAGDNQRQALAPALCAWDGGLAVPSLSPTLWLPVSPAAGHRDVPAVSSGCPQSASGFGDAPEHLP